MTRVLRRRRWLMLAPALVAVATALVASLLHTTMYEGSADVLLQPRKSESPFNPQTGQAFDPGRVVSTDAQVITGRTVTERVKALLGVAPPVAASAAGATDVVSIRARSNKPRQAADIANAYAQSYIELRRSAAVDHVLTATALTQQQLASVTGQISAFDARGAGQEGSDERQALIAQQAVLKQNLDDLQVGAALKSGGAQLLSPATTPTTPVSPTPVLTALLAMFAGLVLGGAAAVSAEYLDDSISAEADGEPSGHGLPIVGTVPSVPTWRRREEARLVSLTEPRSPSAEAYRSLRTAVRFLHMHQPLRVLQVTSPNAGEGKTSTLANLAVVMAGTGQRVCVTCCDLRRPRIHEFFGLSSAVGMTSVIAGQATLTDALQPVAGVPGLSLLAAGPSPPNPSELLSTTMAGEVFADLAARFDIVLVDSPPLLPVTDAALVTRYADVVLMVVAVGRTAGRQLSRAIEVLEQVNAPVAGLVLNETSRGARKRPAARAARPGSAGGADHEVHHDDGVVEHAAR